MLKKLESLMDRYEELSEAIVQPDVNQDYTRLQAFVKEQAELEPAVMKYREYLSVCRHLEEARELLSDPLMAEEAKEEMSSLSARKTELWEELKMLLVPSDPLDSRTVPALRTHSSASPSAARIVATAERFLLWR